MVVGLNSDESIKRIKGKLRPINTSEERIELLTLFDFIDHIILFKEDTPLNVISLLKPNIIVKGGDYEKSQVVGSQYADEVIIFDYILDKSTTHVIDKIKMADNKLI